MDLSQYSNEELRKLHEQYKKYCMSFRGLPRRDFNSWIPWDQERLRQLAADEAEADRKEDERLKARKQAKREAAKKKNAKSNQNNQ